MKRLLKLSIIFVFFSLTFEGCTKEDSSNPDNPTNGKTTAIFNSNVTYSSMTDQEGNIYKTITIGTQTWMAENLRTTLYNDGTSIPLVTDNIAWSLLTTPAYCNYNNTTNIDTIATYGRLYNWHAVNSGKLAPKGWHVPTTDEWSTLTDYLDGTSVAGDKLKETGTTHWNSPNEGATNETGFTALPGGRRVSNGTFFDIAYVGSWWSSTQDNTSDAYVRDMDCSYSDVYSASYSKDLGISVRCVKD